MVAKMICALILMGLICNYGVTALKGKWTALGCYKDDGDRALEKHLGSVGGDDFSQLFNDCRTKAEAQGYRYFGVQNNHECWGSKASNYDKHGCSENCEKKGKYGIGKSWANFVYYKKEAWTPCDCKTFLRYKIFIKKIKRKDCPKYNRKVDHRPNAAKTCIEAEADHCSVDGKWSDFGPWTRCDKLCGDGGKQKRIRTCTSGNDCVGSAELTQDCNSKNCPTPCSYDGLLVQLLNNIDANVTVTNHLVTALTQIVRSMDTVGSNNPISEATLIRMIKAALQREGGEDFARNLLGVVFAKQKGHGCDYNPSIKNVKKEVGEANLKKLINADGDVSLMFTIDTTASMEPLIAQAKAMAEFIATPKRKSKVNYILSTFGETFYLTGKVEKFANAENFIHALKKINPSAGFDCPEPTFAGIIKGISKGHPKPGSPMYVFTDAPPKAIGQYTRDRAIQQARNSETSVNFFLADAMGVCKNQKPRPMHSPDYEAIVRATGGFRLPFFNASSVNKLENLIDADLSGTETISSSRECTRSYEFDNTFSKRSANTIEEFPVDDITKKLIVSVTGTNLKTGVKLYDPNGKEFEAEIDYYNEKKWVILEPKPTGKWRITREINVHSFDKEIKSSAKLDVSVVPSFRRNNRAIPYPLKEIRAEVKIDVPNKSRLDSSSLKYDLVGSLEENALSKKSDDVFESDLPKGEKVWIRMSGKTLTGVDFRRLSEIIQPKHAVIIALTSNTEYTAGKTFTFEAVIHYTGSTSRTFSITAKPSNSGVTITKPESVSVSKGGSKTLRFDITASVSDEFTVEIKATSDDLVVNNVFTFMESLW